MEYMLSVFQRDPNPCSLAVQLHHHQRIAMPADCRIGCVCVGGEGGGFKFTANACYSFTMGNNSCGDMSSGCVLTME